MFPRAAQGCYRNKLPVKARDRRAALLSPFPQRSEQKPSEAGATWTGLCRARQWPRAPGCSLPLGLPGAAQAAEPAGSSPLPDPSSPTVRLLATGPPPRSWACARPPGSAGCGRVAGEVKLEAKAWGKPAAWQLRRGQQQAECSNA